MLINIQFPCINTSWPSSADKGIQKCDWLV